MGTIALGLLACKEPARAPRDDAPRRESTPAHVLRYKPANVPRYQLVATAKTPPGSLLPLDIERTFALEVVAEDDRRVRARVDPRDPLAKYEHVAVLLFPALPAEPVTRGQEWMVPLDVTVPGSARPIVLTHEVRYVTDTVCPSGFGTCAQLALDAPSRTATLRVEQSTWLAVYTFTGEILFDRARGIVARARQDITASVANGPANITVRATLIAAPATE